MMSTPLELFHTAESYVVQHYYSEIKEARKLLKVTLEDVDKTYFMGKYIHVVYCSGFKWSVVNRRWDEIRDTYYYFDVDSIVLFTDEIREEAMKIIGHKNKIDAILKT
ncbi:unnamed protein product, partial [marine sediment metagenome]